MRFLININMREYYGFVYLWENLQKPGQKFSKYIGQHCGSIDDGYIGSGAVFKKIYKKNNGFGWERKILDFCFEKDQKKLNELEELYITKYNALTDHIYCNLRGGGSHGKMSTEAREKMKGPRPNAKIWNRGIKLPDKMKEQISKTKKEQKLKAWNAGKNMGPQSKELIEKRISKVKTHHNKIKKEQINMVVKLLKNNTYITRKDIDNLFNCSLTLTTSIIKKMLEEKIIKQEFLASGYKHIMLINTPTYEEKIIQTIKNSDGLTYKEIHNLNTYVSLSYVKQILYKNKKNGVINCIRGYRKNIYTFNN